MLKELLSDFVTWLLFVVLVLGVILIYAALRRFPPNGYVLVAGIIAAGIPIVIFLIHYNRTLRASRDLHEKEVDDLKKNGTKIPVDLTKCIITSNNWTDEKPRYYHSRVVLLNEISGHGDKNVKHVDTAVSVLQYRHPFKGRKMTFESGVIYKDKTTLSLLLELQKETFIYVDQDNPRRYYFDLEFLGDEV